MGNKDRQKGFTLIELMIIISLIIILGAIAIPSFRGYVTNMNLKSAARDIQSVLLNLKARAIAENIMYRITFNPAANHYIIEQGTDTGPPYTPLEVKTLTSFGNDIGITNADFSDGTSAITFEERGTATTGSIILANSRGSTATITTTISGKTYVQTNIQ